MKKLLGALLMTGALFTACNRDDDEHNNANQTDMNFLQMASYGNHNEIAAGRIADSNGMNLSVKSYGNMMITDHSMAQQELTSIATQLGVNIPQMPDSAHIAMGQMLRMLSGMTFDSTYMSMQIMDHDKTIQLFQNEVSNGNNTSVRNYAQKYLPKIQVHRQMADSIRMGL
jgi:putative membrane protein